MMTDFKINLRRIIFVSKILGIINLSYTQESNTGYLIRNTNSTYCFLLEIIQISVFLMFTYYFRKLPILDLGLLVYKLWCITFTARISEVWIIKLINGIIQFDWKLVDLLAFSSFQQLSLNKKKWDSMVVLSLIYHVTWALMVMYLGPPNNVKHDIVFVTYYLFIDPFFINFVIFISTYFYLKNLECRFQTLNDYWEHMPDDLLPVSGRWTSTEIVKTIENVRMLHAELSDLLKTFSLGYGPLVLVFFVFSFHNMIVSLYFIICVKSSLQSVGLIENVIRKLPPYIRGAQNFICMISIVAVSSRINNKKRKIISYLRLYRISKLPVDVKLQVKMFMNQISIFEQDEMSAFGFFNINLNLVVSIIILLITGLSTLIQMREHPIIIGFVNASRTALKTFIKSESN